MNSSMQDAVCASLMPCPPALTDRPQINLGWKLALVEKGLATPTLLVSYGAERIPVLKEMLVLTTKLLEKRMRTRADGRGGGDGPDQRGVFEAAGD